MHRKPNFIISESTENLQSREDDIRFETNFEKEAEKAKKTKKEKRASTRFSQ